jgi:hypothetical protein
MSHAYWKCVEPATKNSLGSMGGTIWVVPYGWYHMGGTIWVVPYGWYHMGGTIDDAVCSSTCTAVKGSARGSGHVL